MCLIGIRCIGAAYLVYVFSWVEYWSRSAGGVDQSPSLMLINPMRSESICRSQWIWNLAVSASISLKMMGITRLNDFHASITSIRLRVNGMTPTLSLIKSKEDSHSS